MLTRTRLLMIAAMVLGVSAPALSAPLPTYPDRGQANVAKYSFSVAQSGDVSLYFAGSYADYYSTLGFYTSNPNGPASSDVFENHVTPVGTAYDLGTLSKGDVLTFYILTGGDRIFSSDTSLNSDKINHVYATGFAGSVADRLPAGTYIGFEDQLGGDFDYDDFRFIATNLVSSVPLPASAPLFGTALLALATFGYGVNRRRQSKASATA